jgi:hypothetical protein
VSRALPDSRHSIDSLLVRLSTEQSAVRIKNDGPIHDQIVLPHPYVYLNSSSFRPASGASSGYY